MKIRFGKGVESEARDGESILDFTRRMKIPLASGCFNGGCGVCKIHLAAGRVQLNGPISRKHVDKAEEESGYTLACRAVPQSDVEIDQYTELRRVSAWRVTTKLISP
jgi:3-phenylpropionate/trans-cinnamate dioxygenase ferredoxin reductase subunit